MARPSPGVWAWALAGKGRDNSHRSSARRSPLSNVSEKPLTEKQPMLLFPRLSYQSPHQPIFTAGSSKQLANGTKAKWSFMEGKLILAYIIQCFNLFG